MNKPKHGQPEKAKRYNFQLSSLFLLTALLAVLIAWITERNRWQIQKNELLVCIEDAKQSSFDERAIDRSLFKTFGLVLAYVDIGPNCELSTEQELTRTNRLLNGLKTLATMEEFARTKVLRDENGKPNGLRSQHATMYVTALDIIKLLEGTSGKKTSDFSRLQPNKVASFIERIKTHQEMIRYIHSDLSGVPEFKGLGFIEKYLEENKGKFKARENGSGAKK